MMVTSEKVGDHSLEENPGQIKDVLILKVRKMDAYFIIILEIYVYITCPHLFVTHFIIENFTNKLTR